MGVATCGPAATVLCFSPSVGHARRQSFPRVGQLPTFATSPRQWSRAKVRAQSEKESIPDRATLKRRSASSRKRLAKIMKEHSSVGLLGVTAFAAALEALQEILKSPEEKQNVAEANEQTHVEEAKEEGSSDSGEILTDGLADTNGTGSDDPEGLEESESADVTEDVAQMEESPLRSEAMGRVMEEPWLLATPEERQKLEEEFPLETSLPEDDSMEEQLPVMSELQSEEGQEAPEGMSDATDETLAVEGDVVPAADVFDLADATDSAPLTEPDAENLVGEEPKHDVQIASHAVTEEGAVESVPEAEVSATNTAKIEVEVEVEAEAEADRAFVPLVNSIETGASPLENGQEDTETPTHAANDSENEADSEEPEAPVVEPHIFAVQSEADSAIEEHVSAEPGDSEMDNERHDETRSEESKNEKDFEEAAVSGGAVLSAFPTDVESPADPPVSSAFPNPEPELQSDATGVAAAPTEDLPTAAPDLTAKPTPVATATSIERQIPVITVGSAPKSGTPSLLQDSSAEDLSSYPPDRGPAVETSFLQKETPTPSSPLKKSHLFWLSSSIVLGFFVFRWVTGSQLRRTEDAPTAVQTEVVETTTSITQSIYETYEALESDDGEDEDAGLAQTEEEEDAATDYAADDEEDESDYATDDRDDGILP